MAHTTGMSARFVEIRRIKHSIRTIMLAIPLVMFAVTQEASLTAMQMLGVRMPQITGTSARFAKTRRITQSIRLIMLATPLVTYAVT